MSDFNAAEKEYRILNTIKTMFTGKDISEQIVEIVGDEFPIDIDARDITQELVALLENAGYELEYRLPMENSLHPYCVVMGNGYMEAENEALFSVESMM